METMTRNEELREAAAENARLAKLVPELLAACQELVGAANLVDARAAGWPLKAIAAARAALARADAAGAIYNALVDADQNPGDEPEATAWADLDDGSANKPLRAEDLE